MTEQFPDLVLSLVAFVHFLPKIPCPPTSPKPVGTQGPDWLWEHSLAFAFSAVPTLGMNVV